MNKHIYEFAEQAGIQHRIEPPNEIWGWDHNLEKFAELIIKECIDKIETHKIPVGNSPAGELAADWTYDALSAVSSSINEHFGVN
jgi:hypothetical protein